MLWALVTMSSIPAPSVCVTCRHNWPLRRGWPLFSQAYHQTPSCRQPAPEPASTHPICSVEGLGRDLAPLPAGRLRSRQSHHGALPCLLECLGVCKKERSTHGSNSPDCPTFPLDTRLPTPELRPGPGAVTRRHAPLKNKVCCNKHSSNYCALFP